MDVVTVVGVALGIVGVIGVSWAYLRQSMAKTTLSLYREDNEALRGRVDTLERERDELRTKVEDLVGRVGALREERTILRDLATGASAVKNLEQHLNGRLSHLEDLLLKLTNERRGTDEA